MIEVTILPDSGMTAMIMTLSPNEDVVLLERLRCVDGEPLVSERSYLNHRLCPGISTDDLSFSLYLRLHQNYGLKITRAGQIYETVAAGGREAEIVELATYAPVLYSGKITFLNSDESIKRGIAWHRGD